MNRSSFATALICGGLWLLILLPFAFVHWIAVSLAIGVRVAGSLEPISQKLSSYILYIATPLAAILLLLVVALITGYPTAAVVRRFRK